MFNNTLATLRVLRNLVLRGLAVEAQSLGAVVAAHDLYTQLKDAKLSKEAADVLIQTIDDYGASVLSISPGVFADEVRGAPLAVGGTFGEFYNTLYPTA